MPPVIVQVVLEKGRVLWQKRRRRQTSIGGITSGGQKLKDITLLLTQSRVCYHRHNPFHKTATGLALRTKTTFAPEHPWANLPFGQIIDLNVTSPKRSCDAGDCGTCTILIDGAAARSCLTIALTVEGKSIATVEGLNQNGDLHPLQKEFHERYASQCGFCTPGQLYSTRP